MKYSNIKTSAGQVMPLLMGCTRPTSIETEEIEHKIIYDPITQKVVMDLRVLGTRSLKVSTTHKPNIINNKRVPGSFHNVADKKNEIDDSKIV